MRSVLSVWCLAWFGCSGPLGGAQAEFTTSEDINGQNPEAANFAVFGAAELSGQGKFFIVASDDPDPCSQIGNDVLSFGFDVFDGLIPGTVVFIDVSSQNSFPPLGEVFIADGINNFVSIQFIVSDGNSILGSGGMSLKNGTMTVNDFSLGQTLSSEFSGLLDEDVNSAPLNIQVDISGSLVNINHCQALTDFIVNF